MGSAGEFGRKRKEEGKLTRILKGGVEELAEDGGGVNREGPPKRGGRGSGVEG